MYEELDGIDLILYFTDNDKYIHYINMTCADVIDDGSLWCISAYGNALIRLNHSKSTDKLYLMKKIDMRGFSTITMNREEQREYLEQNAKRIIVRQRG